MSAEDGFTERPKESEPRVYIEAFAQHLGILQPLIAKNFPNVVPPPLQKLLEMDIDPNDPESFDRTETVRYMRIAHDLLREKEVHVEVPENIKKYFDEKAEGV